MSMHTIVGYSCSGGFMLCPFHALDGKMQDENNETGYVLPVLACEEEQADSQNVCDVCSGDMIRQGYTPHTLLQDAGLAVIVEQKYARGYVLYSDAYMVETVLLCTGTLYLTHHKGYGICNNINRYTVYKDGLVVHFKGDEYAKAYDRFKIAESTNYPR